MAHMATDGKKFTNRPPMMAHNRMLERASGMKHEPTDQPGMSEAGGEEMEPHHEAIHDHLRNMHEQTGQAHAHIEHHGDGTHTSHHIDGNGEISGPNHHASAEELVNHLKNNLPEEEKEIESGSEEEPEYE